MMVTQPDRHIHHWESGKETRQVVDISNIEVSKHFAVSPAAMMDKGYFESDRWLLKSRCLTFKSHNKEEQRKSCREQEHTGQTDA